jgi:hypothetical protein
MTYDNLDPLGNYFFQTRVTDWAENVIAMDAPDHSYGLYSALERAFRDQSNIRETVSSVTLPINDVMAIYVQNTTNYKNFQDSRGNKWKQLLPANKSEYGSGKLVFYRWIPASNNRNGKVDFRIILGFNDQFELVN